MIAPTFAPAEMDSALRQKDEKRPSKFSQPGRSLCPTDALFRFQRLFPTQPLGLLDPFVEGGTLPAARLNDSLQLRHTRVRQRVERGDATRPQARRVNGSDPSDEL